MAGMGGKRPRQSVVGKLTSHAPGASQSLNDRIEPHGISSVWIRTEREHRLLMPPILCRTSPQAGIAVLPVSAVPDRIRSNAARASIRRSTDQPIEHGLVDGPLEFHTADMSDDPSDDSFDGMKVVELHPNALADFRALDELRLAALGRKIEYANPKAAPASPPDSNIRREFRSGHRPRQFRSFNLRHHDRGKGIG